MSIATAPTDVSPAELIRWAFDTLNRRDIATLKQMWTDDTLQRFPDRTCRGADEIAEYFEEVLAGLSDLHFDVRDVSEDGENVYVHWHLTATHTGPLQGFEPTGKRVELDGIDHFVVRDGKVASNFIVFDQLQYGRQLGVMPPDGSAGDKAMKAAFNVKTKVAKRLKR
jgi:steroid delta-isomerase-like uncharacterized protein